MNNTNPVFAGLLQEALRRGKTPEQTRREANYVEMLLDVAIPAHLLDVPCGEGRLALELAGHRYRITGVDLAPDMLTYARQLAAERNLNDHFTIEERDMRDLPWRDTFDGAYCIWESFGYFDDDGNREFLTAVLNTLKPGSRFMFDTHVAETLLPTMHRRDWERIGDNLFIMEEREYDHATSTVTRRWITVKEGLAQPEPRSLSMRLYTYRELVALVLAAGFTSVEDYTWMSLFPFTMAAPRLMLVARKG